MSPLTLLGCLTLTYAGWQVFDDGPLAFYVSAGLLIVVLLWKIGSDHGGTWWPVCVFGIALGLMQAGCGMLYAGDGRSFICDAGTGLPLSLVVMGAASIIAGWLTRKAR
jgi:hypothetical protein